MIGEPVVFVVDDDASVLRAITRLLRFEFLVQPYDSPATFLAAVHPETPGCILLDLALPGMSGLSLQAQLIEAGCFQPVVFLSGQGSVRTVVQALQAGAIDFIEKPWESEVLIGAVRRALECDREIRSRRDAAVSISQRVMHKMSVRSVAELTRAAELAGVRPEA